jgi:hypothetical protein
MIHLNGSGGEQLMSALQNARLAIVRAEEELVRTSPHPRDYYITMDFEIAKQCYYKRQERLQSVRTELEMIYEGINDQLESARRQKNL